MFEEHNDDIQQVVIDALHQDILAVELQLALLSSALISYRKDSCLRPYPPILHDGSDEKDMESLVSSWLHQYLFLVKLVNGKIFFLVILLLAFLRSIRR